MRKDKIVSPASQSKEVTRYGYILAKCIQFHVLSIRKILDSSGQTAGDDRQRRLDIELECGLDIRGVLTGESAARVDGLTLRI